MRQCVHYNFVSHRDRLLSEREPMKEIDDWSELISSADLRHQLTLDEYFAKSLTETSNPKVLALIRERNEKLRPRLEALAQPGDCWWEWIQGEIPLMQSGGLALVRAGKIVWATLAWIS